MPGVIPLISSKIVEKAFEEIPNALSEGKEKEPTPSLASELQDRLLSDDPQAISDALMNALRSGFTPKELAGEVSFAAACRIARFHTSNEFGDWDTALHTFTFANAVQQGLERIQSSNLLRGVWDAAMSVYLDRFLNIPVARLPEAKVNGTQPKELLKQLEDLLDQQQQVNEAAQLIMNYATGSGLTSMLLAKMGELLLREDRDFHTIQCIEATVRQLRYWEGTDRGEVILIAAARYLAAHAPTMRAQGQTFLNAQRLSRGELLYVES